LEIGENFDDEDFNASKRLKLNKKGHRRNASDSIMSVGSKLSGKISGMICFYRSLFLLNSFSFRQPQATTLKIFSYRRFKYQG
jgi:hypothetical protein